jgi:hypothetical protein
MTSYHYAGDGRPYTGSSYRAMVILGVLVGLGIGVFLALCEYATTPAHAWSTQQWRTYSYCVRVWTQTGGSNPECRYFFTGR